jgi:hypothetical protein
MNGPTLVRTNSAGVPMDIVNMLHDLHTEGKRLTKLLVL